MDDLAYLFGKPKSLGDLRTNEEDFQVNEFLPFQPSGEGEHVFIHIEKKGQNTVYIAKQLAKYFNVRENSVSYAGLKDKHAVTQQYFSIHLPGKKDVDLSKLNISGVKILSVTRHNKKLRIGSLLGNLFKLTLRRVTDIADLEQRWQQIIHLGVPNYFGEQRFGHQGNNLVKAQEMFSGNKVKDKKKRGFYLSAARSYLFNQFVSERIKQDEFNQIIQGDVCMLSGTQSVFAIDSVDKVLQARLSSGDINLTAPLWGQGQLMTKSTMLDFETTLANQYEDFTKGLERFGLKQERRSIRLMLASPQFKIEKTALGDNVYLSFILPAGCFATTILRELLVYNDCSINSIQYPTQE